MTTKTVKPQLAFRTNLMCCQIQHVIGPWTDSCNAGGDYTKGLVTSTEPSQPVLPMDNFGPGSVLLNITFPS